jgi:hypothetical protein
VTLRVTPLKSDYTLFILIYRLYDAERRGRHSQTEFGNEKINPLLNPFLYTILVVILFFILYFERNILMTTPYAIEVKAYQGGTTYSPPKKRVTETEYWEKYYLIGGMELLRKR